MLISTPGDVVATPRSRRSELRSGQAEFIAPAKSGALANAAQPLPTTSFEDSRVGKVLFAALIVAAVLVAAHQFGWL